MDENVGRPAEPDAGCSQALELIADAVVISNNVPGLGHPVAAADVEVWYSSGDWDCDGFNDSFEMDHGTNPQDPESHL